MTSDKRLQSNRANAQKSTGPRTDAGKMRSRANSLTHGLTGAGVVMGRDVEAELEAKRGEFEEYVQPTNPVERVLVKQMALASVRMERARCTEDARQAEQRRTTERRLAKRANTRLRKAIELFENDCARGVAVLRDGSLGCDWMVDQWESLADALRSQGYWDDAGLSLAERLFGIGLRPRLDDMNLLMLLRINHTIARGDVDSLAVKLHEVAPADVVENLLATSDLDPANARDVLLDLIARETDALSDRSESLRTEYEEPERDNEVEAAAIDSSPDGMRLARYEAMSEMSFHRNWGALVRLRKLDPSALGLAAAEPVEARAPNEPNEATSSPEAAGGCASRPCEQTGPSEAVEEPFEDPEAAFEPPAPVLEPVDSFPEVLTGALVGV